MQAAEQHTTENRTSYPLGMNLHRLARRPPDFAATDRRSQTPGARFMDLLEPNFSSLKRFVGGALKHSPDVDDVVQQTVLKAFVHLDQFRFDAQFGTWLRSIAMNEIRQLYRQRSALRTRTVEGVSVDFADGRESPQMAWERRRTEEELHQAIQRLPAKYKAVIRLRYLNGLDVAAVARRLSISVGAVKTRLHRARQQLSSMLAGDAGEIHSIGRPSK